MFLVYVSDDSFISLRYAQRFLAGQGLTWTDGERVEGYTNLLWVLLIAALGAFGVDLLDAAQFLGVSCMCLTVCVLCAYSHRRLSRLDTAAALPILLFVCTTSVAAWSVAGLEQPLVALLLAGVVFLTSESAAAPLPPSRMFAIGFLLSLLYLTRPDGMLFAAGVCVWLLATSRSRGDALRALIRVCAPLAIVFIAVCVFRYSYYGDVVPNTAHIKAGINLHTISYGLRYMAFGAIRYAVPVGILLAAATLVGRDTVAQPRLMLIVPLAGLWAVYVVAVGGDVSLLWRHWIVLLLLSTFAAIELLKPLNSQTRRRWVPIFVVLMTLHVLIGFSDVEARQALGEHFAWEGKRFAEVLRRLFGQERPLLAVEPAGSVPYFSGFPSLDMQGLNDAFIARHSLPTLGRGWIGHDAGNGAYVLARRPDFVLLCSPLGFERACWPGGQSLLDQPAFSSSYRLVRFALSEDDALVGKLWVRTDSEKVGVRRTERKITIPAYLCQGSGASLTYAQPDGGSSTTFEGEVTCPPILLYPGRWSVAVIPSSSEYQSKIFDESGKVISEQAEVQISSSTQIHFAVRAEQPFSVQRFEFAAASQ